MKRGGRELDDTSRGGSFGSNGDGGGSRRHGNKKRSARSPEAFGSFAAAATAVAALATSLHGCDVPLVSGYWVPTELDAGSLKTHHLAAWRTAPDYWKQNSYIDPDSGLPSFNSCMNPMLSVVEVCGGHGSCAPFDPDADGKQVFYCKCDDEWGGLECLDKRKKQSIAWLMSLFFGPLGLDEVYLEMPQIAIHKLLVGLLGAVIAFTSSTALGLGIVTAAWMFDVVRIGIGPVMTNQHRVQTDMSRPVFACLTIIFFSLLGTAYVTAAMYRTVLIRRRRYEHMRCYSSTTLLV